MSNEEQKAKELYEKFLQECGLPPIAKAATIICAEEFISFCESKDFLHSLEFWQQVKEEIEKL